MIAVDRADRAPRVPVVSRPAPVRGRVFVQRDRCKGCELCIEFCPTSVLSRSKDFNARGYHYPIAAAGCINCRLCVTVCPEYAIFSVAAGSRGAAGAAAAANAGGQA
ncbi:MAG: 4Fe-4S binding protein [Candidatus Rokubacteria bacterium]|nr:4Fe-4S binding protein [Candidatus Rokubacteria bacterium]